MRYLPEPPHDHGAIAKIGILLVNLGTPEAPTAAALRPYLKEFLSDPRVVELPRPVWWLILHGIVLNTRPRKSAEKYAKIWTAGGSPLKVHTERQANLLRSYLSATTQAPLAVSWAMRYGTPPVDAGLAQLKAQGCDRVLVVPLYPQYAASSTGSSYDAVFAAAAQMRNVPELRLVKHFHDHPGYIEALARSVRDYWTANGRPERLVMSFHGVPRFTLDRGDPYYCECQKTGRLLAEALGLQPEQYVITFQSRFGRAEWLKPYTQDTVEALGRKSGPDRRGVPRLRSRLPGDPGRDRYREQSHVLERGRRRVSLHSLPERGRSVDRSAGGDLAGAFARLDRAGRRPTARRCRRGSVASARDGPGRDPVVRQKTNNRQAIDEGMRSHQMNLPEDLEGALKCRGKAPFCERSNEAPPQTDKVYGVAPIGADG